MPRRGFTLVELLLVVVILVVLASLLIPLLAGFEVSTATGEKSPERIATEETLQRVRDVILGTPGRPGVWSDVGQRAEFFPQTITALFAETPPYPGLSAFDPATGIGWRGPYVIEATGKDAFGNPLLIDGWGTPILVQVDFEDDNVVTSLEARYARLVSAGPDRQFDTLETGDNMIPGAVAGSELTLAECDDDVVLFLRVPDTRQ